MYSIKYEEIAKNLQRRLNTTGQFSPEKGGKENFNPTDSRLEYRDPTPNIHELFVLFDKRYFWSRLGMVEVKWSNRMTLSAGLCYYQGRGGLCSIKLSAPLLSLRPRKDLVETLLHEMIHAYLFVTQNNKDRDGHGPEFHKHMNRINKEAGTNITVYHTFQDEVTYYQKHIWRCNGPCQNRRPFFGFVKRAMNRAPGPNDNWWQEHQNNCGGTFIKVSEPEKPNKKKTEHEKDKRRKIIGGVKDIRDFFQSETVETSSSTNYKENTSNTSNIHTLKDLNNGAYSQNEHGARNSDKTNAKIMLKTDADRCDKFNDRDEQAKVRETVRNVWLNKYPSLNSTAKRPNNSESFSSIDRKRKEIMCPVCSMPFSETAINEHVDECLSNEESAEILNVKMPVEQIQDGSHKSEISCEEGFNFKPVQCPVCGEGLQRDELDEHLEICLNFTFQNDDTSQDDEIDCDKVPCPCCLKWVTEKSINDHIDECLTFIALKSDVKGD